MNEIWNELRSRHSAVKMDTEDYQALIYQGVKMVKEGERYVMLSTESNFYPRVRKEIVDIFLTEGVDEGMRAYKADKYKRQLEECELPSVQKYLSEKLSKL